jgi:hypothetical protein
VREGEKGKVWDVLRLTLSSMELTARLGEVRGSGNRRIHAGDRRGRGRRNAGEGECALAIPCTRRKKRSRRSFPSTSICPWRPATTELKRRPWQQSLSRVSSRCGREGAGRGK